MFSNKMLLYHDDFLNHPEFDVYVCSEKCKTNLYKAAEQIWKNNFSKAKKYSKDYFCRKCQYLWTSKKQIGEPAFCPKCRKDDIVKYTSTKQWEQEYKNNKQESIQDIVKHYDFLFKSGKKQMPILTIV